MKRTPALALLPLLFAGCALVGTTQAERVARLEADLNESRTFAYQNFDPSIDDYLLLVAGDPRTTWDAWFPPAEWPETTLYAIEISSTADDSVTASVDGPEQFGGPRTLTIGLVRLGLDWYISSLELSGESPSLIVQ
jgi:hypothetical protein